jgi:hypothetical protein
LAIDLINGSSLLREWVDDPKSKIQDFEELTLKDESDWSSQIEDFFIYR